MRIRKNVNLSTILQVLAPEWRLQRHVCRLNQSPWDVIDFSDEKYLASSLNQFGGNNNFEVNTSLGISTGVVKSAELMMECEGDKVKEMETKVDSGRGKDEEPKKIEKKKFGRRLNSKTSVSTKRSAAAVDREIRAKKRNSLNANEFYYYSGFGPSWRKRRVGRNGGRGEEAITNSKSTKSENVEGDIAQNTPQLPPPPQSLPFLHEKPDFVEEEGEDYEQRSSNGGKKRVGRLVKARSLKSLMLRET